MKTRILSLRDVKTVLSMPKCIELQEQAFRLIGEDKAHHSENAWLMMPYANGWLKLLSGALSDVHRAAAKVSIRLPDLPAGRNLGGVIVLFNTADGSVRAIVDAVYISAIRTGAAAGVAARHLATRGPARVGVVGTGAQARYALAGVAAAMPEVTEASVYSRRPENRDAFAESMSRECGLTVSACASAKQAVEGADVVITATNATQPVVEAHWLKAGTVALFVGSKREVPDDVFKGARIVVDSVDLALKDGKLASAVASGRLRADDLHGALSDVLDGKVEGGPDATRLTIYDASGLGEQDAICAEYVCEEADRRGLGVTVDFHSDLFA